MSAEPGQITFAVRIDGETHVIPLSDLLYVSVGDQGGAIHILPGTAGRCIQLGADQLMAEVAVKGRLAVAKACRRPEPTPALVTATKSDYGSKGKDSRT